MQSPVFDQTLADLVEHTTWVRRLARSLVHDDALADDLTQDAWVAALAHPPLGGMPVRPWLGQVMRNLIRMRYRSESRRRGREVAAQTEAAAGDGHGDSPEELLARVETQRALTDLVVALEEPFRSTLLLRFYEGLSAAEIAARLGVPAGTVRWRLKTALERLRAALDRRHGGDRRAWLPVLAPLSLPLERGREGAAGAQGLATSAKLPGVLSLKAWLSMFLILSVGATGLFLAPRWKTEPRRPQTSVAPPLPVSATPHALRITKQERSQLLARITQAQKQAAGAAVGKLPELDANYIREQMRTLLPLVRECYENALRNQPRLAGKLSVRFAIVAERELGGLVADSAISDEDSTITDAGLRECVQETMYGARFPAPREGGELVVSYPFVFSPDR